MKTHTRDYRRSERGEALLAIVVVTVVLTTLIGGATFFSIVATRKPIDQAVENVVNNRATPEDMETLQRDKQNSVQLLNIAVAGGGLIGPSGPVPDISDVYSNVFQDMTKELSGPPQVKDNPISPTQIPSHLDKMHRMVDNYTQVKNMINDIKYWDQVLGETITEPRQISTTSQVASGRSVASDIELAQQQAIEKIRQQRLELEALQNRMRDLINSYNNSRGRVGRDWSESWDAARQDWQRIIGVMSKPHPGSTTGSTGSRSGSQSADHAHDSQGRDIGAGRGNLGPAYDDRGSRPGYPERPWIDDLTGDIYGQ